MKYIICLLSLWVALGMNFGVAFAGGREFPGVAWGETRTVREKQKVCVKDTQGKTLLYFHSEPAGDFLKHVVVSQGVDRLVIDARAAFQAGMRKLVFCSSDMDVTPFLGRDCTLTTKLGGASGAKMLMYFEGHGETGRHYYTSRKIIVRSNYKSFSMIQNVPEWVKRLHLRWDLEEPGKGVLIFSSARYGTITEAPIAAARKHGEAKLLFHVPFDGTAVAAVAGGNPKPVIEKAVTFVEGKKGKAIRLTQKAKSVLAYAMKGNVVPECGTVSMWFMREWPDMGCRENGSIIWRCMFANPVPPCERIGTGELWFWNYGPQIRADQSDDDDSFTSWHGADPEKGWNHLAVSWDDIGIRIYLNGRSQGRIHDGESPMIRALKAQDVLSFGRKVFETFYVGCRGNVEQFDGRIDDLRVYSAPLSDAQIVTMYRNEKAVELSATGCYAVAGRPGSLFVSAVSPSGMDLSGFSYCLRAEDGSEAVSGKAPVAPVKTAFPFLLPEGRYTLCVTDGKRSYGNIPVTVFPAGNPYERKASSSLPAGVPEMELVETLRLDHVPPASRFRAVGPTVIKRLGDTAYLEAGADAGNRYALRFSLDTNAPLYCFEIDYPDDTNRTADLIIQKSSNPSGDYTMQVGYAAGDEYPNTKRILTHRCLYWTCAADVTLVVMTACDQSPAAVSAVRIYRVKNGTLPPLAVREPQTAQEGWNRMASLYFEDPAIGYDFAVGKMAGFLPDELDKLINRTAALMKFTGENLFAYPGVWYHGLIGERYNPRHHAPDFLSAWYAKFNEEKLFLMPTLNINTMPVSNDLVTRQSMSDGSLHNSIISILDTGKPNWGGWHNTPPNFNIQHPAVRAYVEELVDALLEQGRAHPSFRGICLHLTRHCLLWFGDEQAGYNDYTVDAFAKAKGLTIPVDRTNPLRGRAYAEWIRSHAWDAWLQWRCDVVTDFYALLARKLSAARPDLKLWVNSFVPANINHPDFLKLNYLEQANRACGLDRNRLTRDIPNIILCQSLVPADYRWRSGFPSPERKARQRELDTLPGFYSLLQGARYPWVNQHDRYWESPIGRDRNTLSCDWLKECEWRVSTINPAGFHALRHFVLPFRYSDVLGLSKGGFLIGTYGMEDYLAPFLQAFRALPAVAFSDIPPQQKGPDSFVRLRGCEFNGKSYFYVVNTGMTPVTVNMTVPARTRDLVSGNREGGLFGSSDKTWTLAPYEMRSFAAPSGRPTISGATILSFGVDTAGHKE